jgi:hypothetical protein
VGKSLDQQEKLDGRGEALDPAAVGAVLGGAGGQVRQLAPGHRHLLRRQRRLRHNEYVVSWQSIDHGYY